MVPTYQARRVSLKIGLAVLTISLIAVQFVFRCTGGGAAMSGVFRESLLIGGWVAMWRPLKVFLYGWWPIRAEARLFDRLAAMPVRLSYAGDAMVG